MTGNLQVKQDSVNSIKITSDSKNYYSLSITMTEDIVWRDNSLLTKIKGEDGKGFKL
jgi:hypothetical protein